MRNRRRAVVALPLFAVLLLPGVAGAQSSNSSSNCSDGRCTRMESFVPEDGSFRQGWTRFESWVEGERPRARPRRPEDGRAGPWAPGRPGNAAPRRDRDDDDDDD